MTTDLKLTRRCRIDLLTPAERAIYDAMGAVESAGADIALTDAVVLLQAARDRVADFVDGVPGKRMLPREYIEPALASSAPVRPCAHCLGDSPDPGTAARERMAVGLPPKGMCCEWSRRIALPASSSPVDAEERLRAMEAKLRDACGGSEPSAGHDLADEVIGLLRVARSQRDDAWTAAAPPARDLSTQHRGGDAAASPETPGRTVQDGDPVTPGAAESSAAVPAPPAPATDGDRMEEFERLLSEMDALAEGIAERERGVACHASYGPGCDGQCEATARKIGNRVADLRAWARAEVRREGEDFDMALRRSIREDEALDRAREEGRRQGIEEAARWVQVKASAAWIANGIRTLARVPSPVTSGEEETPKTLLRCADCHCGWEEGTYDPDCECRCHTDPTYRPTERVPWPPGTGKERP